MTSGGDEPDPWDFLASRKKEMADRAAAAPVEKSPEPSVSPPPRAGDRARGELRTEMSGPTLRRRGWPLALSLALVSFAGFMTEVVASSQMLAMAGPRSLLIIYPLGGIGLILLAMLQFKYVDQRARLPMLRWAMLGYAIAFGVAFGLITGSVVPVVATGLVWLLADQMNFLLPLLLWSLAGDEFNVAESQKVYPWIVTWTYAGQVLGLAVSALSPALLTAVDIPLTTLLVIDPIVCGFIALWLPWALRHSAAARGTGQPEHLKASFTSAWEFIQGVPVWRHMLVASALTFVAGGVLYLAFLASAEEFIGSDAASLQTLLGWVGLGWFALCWAIQTFAAERLQARIGIAGVLLILPIAAVLSGVLLALGSVIGSMTVMIAGVSLWVIPQTSVDANARRAALALVPDERRARVSFLIDLGPIALGLIVSGPLALAGILTGWYWLIPAVAVVFALLAIRPALQVRSGWEDSMLNWRLRRRKQNRTLDFGEGS